MVETLQAVLTRRSIRRFKSAPVPEALIREILEASRWAPSWGNTQPWEVMVLTGNALERFKKGNQQRIMDGVVPDPDTPMPGAWPDILKRRYVDVGKKVLTALQIPREDREARNRYNGDMFALFNAPCLLLFCVDKNLAREYAMLDIGAIVQTVCLLALTKGLGSCILAASVHYPSMIREIIAIPETKAVIIGVAVGYTDENEPVNQYSRERVKPDEFTCWFK